MISTDATPGDPPLGPFATVGPCALNPSLDEDGLQKIIDRKRQARGGWIDGLAASRQLTSAQTVELPILFLLPGSLGYGPSLTELAASVAKVARVAPVRYPDLSTILNGRNTLQHMAEAVVEQIVRLQPSGDIRLLGHSVGGAVAFEVATLLLAAGRSVRFVGLLDTSLMGERSSYWQMITRTISRIRANRVTTSRMACRALAKLSAAIGSEARLSQMVDKYTAGQFNVTSFRLRLELQEVLREKAYFNWSSQPKAGLPIPVTLFRCERKGMPATLGWESLFAAVDVLPIVGGHVDLGMQPHVLTNSPIIVRAVIQTYCPVETIKIAAGDRSDSISPEAH